MRVTRDFADPPQRRRLRTRLSRALPNRKVKARRRNLVNAEHRDEVAFCQAPPRRTISTNTLRMMRKLYDRWPDVRIRFPKRVRS